jgi:hypothetical protein
MAAEKKYPKIGRTAWFYLRDRAEKSPTFKVTPSNVQAMLSLSSAGSARDNVVSPLTRLGIIDDEGALTERGALWRNKDTYAKACHQIVEEFYPEELRGIDDTAAVERWFNGQGFGASNARQMAATYNLLTDAAVPEEITVPGQKAGNNGKTKSAPKQERPAPATKSPVVEKAAPVLKNDSAPPSLQMNLQIHLPSNATAEQIDMIFASMAKHLYGK